MAQATGAHFISSAAEGATYGAINRSPFYSLAAEGATHDASNGQPFHARRARAQPMAHRKVERVIHGAPKRRPF